MKPDHDGVAAALRSSGAMPVFKTAGARRSLPRLTAAESLQYIKARERTDRPPASSPVASYGAERVVESELLRLLHDRLPRSRNKSVVVREA